MPANKCWSIYKWFTPCTHIFPVTFAQFFKQVSVFWGCKNLYIVSFMSLCYLWGLTMCLFPAVFSQLLDLLSYCRLHAGCVLHIFSCHFIHHNCHSQGFPVAMLSFSQKKEQSPHPLNNVPICLTQSFLFPCTWHTGTDVSIRMLIMGVLQGDLCEDKP